MTSHPSASLLLLSGGLENWPGLPALLVDLGVTLVRPVSTDEALARAGEGDVAAVLLEADEAGLALGERLRSRTAATPLLFRSTAGLDEGRRRRLYALGRADHLAAPFWPEALAARVGLLVELHRAARRAHAPRSLLELRQAEGRLRFALRAGRMGTWDLDLATLEMTCSDICKENYGRQAGDSFSYEDLAASVHDDDRAWWRRAVDESIARAVDLEVEYRCLWPDGSVHWVHVRASCVTDAHGRTVALSGVSLNVDERKQLEARLRLLDAVGEATRLAADPSAVLAASTRLLGQHLRATRCAYADLEADNDRFTIRHDWTVPGAISTVGTYSLDRFGSRAAHDLRAGRTLIVRDVDAELTPGDGADMFNAIGIKAIICCPLVKQGRLVAMMAVHQASPRTWTAEEVSLTEQLVDRSWAHIERIRAAEVLREQDQRKDEFLATLAHELRNPMAPIRTGLELLDQVPSDDPVAVRARTVMERQIKHMVRLIDDLLDVSRINTGKVEMRKERLTLQAALDVAIEASRPSIEAVGHSLRLDIPAEPLRLEGDLTRLAQVVSNLLHNATKYTPNGGRIELSAAREGDEAVVRVTDNGTGITAEMLPRVFDLFTQVNRTLSRAQGGLGIGLSLVRKLLELHGGTITAQSPGLGQGSTFTVRLPLAASDLATPTPRPVVPAPVPASGRRILVVDDNVDGAEMLVTMLGLHGHQTRIAYDGPEALAAARAFDPELIFLDLGLPGMSGYEVARLLRADPAFAQTSLVALTGWGTEDDKRRTRQAGFDAHLTKPMDVAAVAAVLARFLPAGPG